MRLMLNAIFTVAVSIIVIMLVNTFNNSPEQPEVTSVEKVSVDSRVVAEHFSKALMIKTLSEPSQFDANTFRQFHDFLATTYPLSHRFLRREVVNEYSLLYTWEGKNKALKPIQLMGHFDAAPTEHGVEKEWTHDPFSGVIADGYVWGRGAMHSKLNVITILESIELLLQRGYVPERTVYLAFGHDDDVIGDQGAAKIGALLASRGVELEYVLEEGGMIIDGIIDGVDKPIAQLAVAEKGYLTIEMTTHGDGGHSSMVPNKTAIGVLSQAVSRLENHQFTAIIAGATSNMLNVLSKEMPFGKRFVLSNLWMFESLVSSQFSNDPVQNALIRTTLATTVISGGVKDNLLPINASAVANIRIIPGDTVEGVLKEISDVIDDPRVIVSVKNNLAYDSQTMLSPTNSWGYKVIEKTIHQLYPNMIVAPSQLTAVTDTRNYQHLTNNLYRFQPTWISSVEDTRRIHGIDERTSVDNLTEFVQFYVQLIKNSTQGMDAHVMGRSEGTKKHDKKISQSNPHDINIHITSEF